MILSAAKIRDRMNDPYPRKLVVSPVLDATQQLQSGEGSMDLRLGQEFMLPDPAVLGCLDALDEAQAERELTGYLRAVHVSLGGTFVLHPRQFALAATLEYLRLPTDISAHVMGRSRWARVGLIIAMATYVHPGYAGCLTLELQNLGEAPIQLSPGFPIAQLLFEEVKPPHTQQPGQLACATGPEFWSLLSNSDLAKLTDLRRGHDTLTGDRGWTDHHAKKSD